MINFHLKKIKIQIKSHLLNNIETKKKCFFFEKVLEKTFNSIKFTKNSFYESNLNKLLNKKKLKFPLVVKEFKLNFDCQFILLKYKLFLSNKTLSFYNIEPKLIFIRVIQNFLNINRFFKTIKLHLIIN